MTANQLSILLLLVFWGSLCPAARGQSLSDSLTYKIQLGVSGTRIAGIFSNTSVATVSAIELNKGHWQLLNRGSYRFNNTNGAQIEDNWYDLLTIIYYPNQRKKWFPFAFYHFDNNLLFRVQRRHRLGSGLGSLVVNKDRVYLQFGMGAGFESTLFNGAEFANSDLDQALRENGLFLLSVDNNYTLVEGRVALKINVFYMQSLKERSDYDLWIRPNLNIQLSKHFTFQVHYDYRFENVHLEDLVPVNEVLLFGINVHFANIQ